MSFKQKGLVYTGRSSKQKHHASLSFNENIENISEKGSEEIKPLKTASIKRKSYDAERILFKEESDNLIPSIPISIEATKEGSLSSGRSTNSDSECAQIEEEIEAEVSGEEEQVVKVDWIKEETEELEANKFIKGKKDEEFEIEGIQKEGNEGEEEIVKEELDGKLDEEQDTIKEMDVTSSVSVKISEGFTYVVKDEDTKDASEEGRQSSDMQEGKVTDFSQNERNTLFTTDNLQHESKKEQTALIKKTMETRMKKSEEIETKIESVSTSNRKSIRSSKTSQDRLDTISIAKSKLHELMSVQRKNTLLKRNLVAYFISKGMKYAYMNENPSFEAKTKYLKRLKLYEELKEITETDKQKKEEELSLLKAQLSELQNQYEVELQAYLEKQREIVKNHIDPPTGRMITQRLMKRQLNLLNEVCTVRLQQIKLQHLLVRKQEKLKNLDKTEGDLNLIEFEKLRLDNLHYKEKIDDREEELIGFRNKTNKEIEEITHIRSKADAIQNDINYYHNQLMQFLNTIVTLREEINKLKVKRDNCREETRKLKQKAGLLIQPKLLDHLEISNERIQQGRITEDELLVKFDEQNKIVKQLRLALSHAHYKRIYRN